MTAGNTHTSSIWCITAESMASILMMQVFLKPEDTYAIHIDVKTADKNTTRVSISNLFSAETAKVGVYVAACGGRMRL